MMLLLLTVAAVVPLTPVRETPIVGANAEP